MEKTKEVPLQQNPTHKKNLRWFQYLGDGAGQFALNTLTGLIAIITFFYTEKIGIAPAMVGTILFIAKIFDAFTDLIMGRIVEKTHTRWGKARPWFLWLAIPFSLIIVALFTVPTNLSANGKIAYALITNIMATAVLFTAVSVPYGCLMSLCTNQLGERSNMGIIRACFGAIPGAVISIGFVNITNAMSKTGEATQREWIILSMVFAAIALVTILLPFFAMKETNSNIESEEKDAELPFMESVKILFKNKYWVIMLFVSLLTNISMALGTATITYYAKWILGDEGKIVILGLAGSVPMGIGFFIISILLKKIGPAKTSRIFLLIGIIATAIRCFFPRSFVFALLCGAFGTFAIVPFMLAGGVLTNNTIEYNELKFGHRLVGMTNSVTGFGAKIGGGLGASMIGWLLALGNYQEKSLTQPDSAINMILVLCIYLPLVLLLAQYLLMRKYDLDEKYEDIVKELEEQKTSAAK